MQKDYATIKIDIKVGVFVACVQAYVLVTITAICILAAI